MRIIITGGTGLIGSKLAADLGADGNEVIVLSRSPQKHSFPPGVRGEKWDAETANGWGHWVNGADAIVNLAGASIAGESALPVLPQRWTPERRQRILQSRLNVGAAVVEAVRQAEKKPRVLIQASAVGIYGGRGDEELSETAAPANDFLGSVVQQWEASTAEVEQMGVRRVCVRTGVVLSMEEGALPRLVFPFKLFVGGPLGSGKQWMPWIHIEDEVRAIRFLIENEQASGPVNVAAPNPLRYKTLAQVLGKVMKRPSLIPVPGFALRLLLGDVSSTVLEGQRVRTNKLEGLGFQYNYPHIEPALRDLLS